MQSERELSAQEALEAPQTNETIENDTIQPEENKEPVRAKEWTFRDEMIKKGMLDPFPDDEPLGEVEQVKPIVKLVEEIQRLETHADIVENKVKCTSSVNSWIDDRLQWAYDISGGDMDFLGTVSAESMWDYEAVGDDGHAYGLCQWHDYWHKDKQRHYKNLKTGEEKIEYCYETYKAYVEAGNIENRLYGYNVRHEGLRKLWISCK